MGRRDRPGGNADDEHPWQHRKDSRPRTVPHQRGRIDSRMKGHGAVSAPTAGLRKRPGGRIGASEIGGDTLVFPIAVTCWLRPLRAANLHRPGSGGLRRGLVGGSATFGGFGKRAPRGRRQHLSWRCRRRLIGRSCIIHGAGARVLRYALCLRADSATPPPRRRRGLREHYHSQKREMQPCDSCFHRCHPRAIG